MLTCTKNEFAQLIDMLEGERFAIRWERKLLALTDESTILDSYIKHFTPAYKRPFTAPLTDMPLLVNECMPGTYQPSMQAVFAKWRLSVLGR